MERWTWTLKPLVGAEELRFGMSLPEVVELLGPSDGAPTKNWGSDSLRVSWQQGVLALDFGPGLEFIELSAGGAVCPILEGVRVFEVPAEALVRDLVARGYTFDTEPPGKGHGYTFPALQLGLWRPVVPETPTDPQGRYFATVGLGRPGYYDA